MSCENLLVRAEGLGKCFRLYDKPHYRLLQGLYRGRKQFFREFWALRDVSFELHKGESLGIVGRNGAGKSTLLQLLSGVLDPSTGSMQVNGRVAALLELGSGFNYEFTGRENAYLNGSILGLSREEMDVAMPEIERFAGVGDFFDQPVKLYSSGMVVRVAFAVQVQLKPDILIVDEALAVGDIIFQKRCFQRMRELLANGTSLILVTHDTESIRMFAQKALLLDQGCLVASGNAKEVLNTYQQMVLEEEKKYMAAYIAKEVAIAQGYMEQTEEPGGAQKQSVDEEIQTDVHGYSSRRAQEFGTFDAVIASVRVLDKQGKDANLFLTGDPLRIVVSFKVFKDMDSLVVSIRIRNREGAKCYSWGTLNQDIYWKATGDSRPLIWNKHFEAGHEYSVAFDTDSCALGIGFYEVEAQLSTRTSMDFRAEETIVHWLVESAFFSIRADSKVYFFGGICDMHMQAMLLTGEMFAANT
jgi:lipopolysaccharide transport system ATP-binding protein